MSALVLALVSVLAVAANPADSGPADSGATDAVDSGSSATAPSQDLSWSVTLLDGGGLDLDGGVPPDAALRIELAPRLADFRVRLLDSAAHQISATEDVRLDDHTVIEIRPNPALQPGTRYSLVLEPDVSDAVRDASGHPYSSAQLGLCTSGDPPVPQPKSKKRHRKHRN